VFSSPWSLEFVLAVVIGAMLVPGCRPADGSPQSRRRLKTASEQLDYNRGVIRDRHVVVLQDRLVDSATNVPAEHVTATNSSAERAAGSVIWEWQFPPVKAAGTNGSPPAVPRPSGSAGRLRL